MDVSRVCSHGFCAAAQMNQAVEHLYLLLSLLLVGGIVVFVVMRLFLKPSKRRGPGIDVDTGFLDNVRQSDLLSDQERKRVRDAMVRQALAKRAADKPADAASLMAFAEQAKTRHAREGEEAGQPGPGPSEKTGEPGPAPETGDPESSASPRNADRDDEPAAADGEKPIDIDTLFEHDLIDRDEYLRMKNEFDDSPPENE